MVFKMMAEDILVSCALAISCNKSSMLLKLEIGRSLNLRGRSSGTSSGDIESASEDYS